MWIKTSPYDPFASNAITGRNTEPHNKYHKYWTAGRFKIPSGVLTCSLWPQGHRKCFTYGVYVLQNMDAETRNKISWKKKYPRHRSATFVNSNLFFFLGGTVCCCCCCVSLLPFPLVASPPGVGVNCLFWGAIGIVDMVAPAPAPTPDGGPGVGDGVGKGKTALEGVGPCGTGCEVGKWWDCDMLCNCKLCCWIGYVGSGSSNMTMVQYPSREESNKHWPSGDLCRKFNEWTTNAHFDQLLTMSYQ